MSRIPIAVSACAALLLTGTAIAAVPAPLPLPPAPTVAPAPPPGPPLPDGTHLAGPTAADWLQVTLRKGDENVKELVTGLLRELYGPTPAGEADFHKLLESRYALSNLPELPIKEGPNAGVWRFLYRAGAVMPSDAIRLRVADTAPYRVSAEVHCASRECKGVDAELARLRLPWPRKDQSEEVRKSWRTLVATEDCVTGPPHQPPPSYPREEQRAGIEGTTTVLLIYNRCGDVRTQKIVRSSGNRNLDAAALVAASGWRVPTYEPGVSESANVDIKFTLDEPPPPPP